MRLSILAAGALAASILVLAAGNAHAQAGAAGGPAFGQSGELAVSWDQPLVAGSFAAIGPANNSGAPAPMALTPIGFQYYTVSGNGGSATLFSLAPAVDYFVIDNLSIGGQLMFGVLSESPPNGGGQSTT